MDAASVNPLPPTSAISDSVIGSGEEAAVGSTSPDLYIANLAGVPDCLQPFPPSSAVTQI